MNIYEKTIIYFLPQCQNILLKHFPIVLRTDNLWKTLSPLYTFIHLFIELFISEKHQTDIGEAQLEKNTLHRK